MLAVALPLCAQKSQDEVTPEVQQLYAEAHAAQQRGDVSAAIAKYRAMIRLAPHLAAAYNNLGMLYFDRQEYAEAAEVLEHGLKVKPNMTTAAAMLGMSYFQLGENEKAEAPLRTALKANPADSKVELMLIHNLIILGKLREATEQLNGYLGRNPKDQEAWYLQGKAYMQLSEQALSKINAIDPDSVLAHEISGEIDASMHNYDLALVEYKKAVDMAPRRPGTHMHMGEAYWLTGKWASAESEFKAEIENDPNNCQARWKLANSILEANEPADGALSQLNASIERCPRLMQARVDRARALVKLGRHGEALADLQMAVADSPNEPLVHFLLAQVYRAAGKSAEAQQELKLYGQLQQQVRDSVADQAKQANAIKETAQ